MDILDVLLDEDNCGPITFVDTDGRIFNFEQVAVIPFETKDGRRKIYCVLKPLDHIDGIANNEAMVFFVDTDDDGESVIRLEEDESTAVSVFEKYYDLMEEAAKTINDKELASDLKARISKLRSSGKNLN